MNFEIRELEDKIIALLNESNVCAEAKRLIMADVSHLVGKQADSAIINELQGGENEQGIR